MFFILGVVPFHANFNIFSFKKELHQLPLPVPHSRSSEVSFLQPQNADPHCQVVDSFSLLIILSCIVYSLLFNIQYHTIIVKVTEDQLIHIWRKCRNSHMKLSIKGRMLGLSRKACLYKPMKDTLDYQTPWSYFPEFLWM